jgi:HK97 gp10 family phage protein
VIKVNIDRSQLRGLQARIDRASKEKQRAVNDVIKETTIAVHKEAIESISKKGSGRTYELYIPRRTHTASAPNNPPATDTGFLKNNLRWETIKSAFTGKVISGADYSVYLEFGTSQMEQRPFMRPALEKNYKAFINNVKRALK